RLSAKP
nr:Chain PA, RLSAKP Peptide [synthetic construct]7Q8Q_PB Chain PB, RLSAKP Peptide [synthetic construct]